MCDIVKAMNNIKREKPTLQIDAAGCEVARMTKELEIVSRQRDYWQEERQKILANITAQDAEVPTARLTALASATVEESIPYHSKKERREYVHILLSFYLKAAATTSHTRQRGTKINP